MLDMAQIKERLRAVIDSQSPSLVTREDIQKVLPQRYEMELLDGVLLNDTEIVIGYKDLTKNDFWARGHFPDRPIFPGVLMIEFAAQLLAFSLMTRMPERGLMVFAKCEETRFRGLVEPPGRFYMVAEPVGITEIRSVGLCKGFYGEKLVFETKITGMSIQSRLSS